MPSLITAQSTYKVSAGVNGLLSACIPLCVLTTNLSDHPAGMYGVRFGKPESVVRVGLGVRVGVEVTATVFVGIEEGALVGLAVRVLVLIAVRVGVLRGVAVRALVDVGVGLGA